VVTVAPRLVLGRVAAGGWDDDTAVVLPAGAWTDAMTGAAVRGGRRPLRDLLGRFPVALLERES
jgi:(1->4)-alpha-D-glucan 1-alpha-D-glucosylmutase